jgi:hypothetical protein
MRWERHDIAEAYYMAAIVLDNQKLFSRAEKLVNPKRIITETTLSENAFLIYETYLYNRSFNNYTLENEMDIKKADDGVVIEFNNRRIIIDTNDCELRVYSLDGYDTAPTIVFDLAVQDSDT